MIDYIVTTNPGDLYCNLRDMVAHLQENYGTKHELNKYRKSFGNIKDCVNAPGTKMVFRLDGTCFRF